MKGKHSRTVKDLTLGPRDSAIVFRADPEVGGPVSVEFYTPNEGVYPEEQVPATEPVMYTATLGGVLAEPGLFGLAVACTTTQLDKLAKSMKELN